MSSYFRTCEGNVGNYTQFVSYRMTFCLALPSWLLKVPSVFCCVEQRGRANNHRVMVADIQYPNVDLPIKD